MEQTMKIESELTVVASPTLEKAVASEINNEDKDIDEILNDRSSDSTSDKKDM